MQITRSILVMSANKKNIFFWGKRQKECLLSWGKRQKECFNEKQLYGVSTLVMQFSIKHTNHISFSNGIEIPLSLWACGVITAYLYDGLILCHIRNNVVHGELDYPLDDAIWFSFSETLDERLECSSCLMPEIAFTILSCIQ